LKTSEIVNVSVGLSATPASQANFSVPMLMIDTALVPVYRRYRTVSRSSYATVLATEAEALAWCTTLWGQNYNPALCYIGRWISADTAPMFICNNALTTIATWAAVTDGCCTVTTTAGADALTSLNFSTATSLADVAAIIDSALDSGGVSGAACAVDALGYIYFYDTAVVGSGADTVVVSASGSGTHIENSTYLNVAAGFAQGGLDAETLSASANAIFAITDVPFAICQIGGTDDQKAAFSTGMNALAKLCLLVETDTDAKSSGHTTDTGYQIEALSHQKTHITYTEHTGQYPDAAICGEILPRTEASTALSFIPLSGVSESGLHADGSTVIPLTSDERTALEAKGYDYLIAPAGLTHLRHGLAAGGYEIRIMIAKMFLEAKVTEGVYGYMVANNVVTFSDSDIQAIKGIVTYWADILVDRKAIDPGYTITMPSAADFTAATKATHIMTLSDIMDADTQKSVNSVNITMSFSV
jgi:hypothetical protein